MTIAGHPQDYLKGYNVEKTLEGHGMTCAVCDGEDLDALYKAMRAAVLKDGPVAVVAKRKMCPGVEGVEGTCHGHDAIAVANAITYLEKKGYKEAVQWLQGPATKAEKDPRAGTYLGTKGSSVGANRAEFGNAVRGGGGGGEGGGGAEVVTKGLRCARSLRRCRQRRGSRK